MCAVADPEAMLLVSETWDISTWNKNSWETGLNKWCARRNAECEGKQGIQAET